MYYNKRKKYQYYSIVKEILESIGPYDSILDIGSYDTPIASFGNFNKRYTIDIINRPNIQNVTKIIGRWPDVQYMFKNGVSVITCLQVIEHVKNYREFIDKIFETAKEYVIISVPYKWPKNKCGKHIHDPIDKEKLFTMVKRNPIDIKIDNSRMTAVYKIKKDKISIEVLNKKCPQCGGKLLSSSVSIQCENVIFKNGVPTNNGCDYCIMSG